MPRKLFIGGLAWKTDDASLNEAFAPFGDILEARVVLDRETGRSRGFGFVTYNSDDGATNAQKEMDGKMLDGRAIRVDIAREQPGGRRP
jgi:RNA recognition motif-containing protein